MMFSVPMRGSGPGPEIPVRPPRQNAAALRAAGAPGLLSQASSAGSTQRNIVVVYTTEGGQVLPRFRLRAAAACRRLRRRRAHRALLTGATQCCRSRLCCCCVAPASLPLCTLRWPRRRCRCLTHTCGLTVVPLAISPTLKQGAASGDTHSRPGSVPPRCAQPSGQGPCTRVP